MQATATAATAPICTLTYNMGDLGDQVYYFDSESEANHFLHKENPPDLLVRSVYLDFDGLRHFTPNCFFWPAGYNYAVEEKRWREGYYRRTGRVWNEDECGGNGGKKGKPPGGGNDDKDLDYDACLRLLGLRAGFTDKELKDSHREAIKRSHPDKVATLAEEFQLLAERRTRQINQAYAKLLGKS
jgi:hypothetical protein